MIDILTPQFFKYHNKERIKNKLYTNAIWPADQVLDVSNYQYLGAGQKFYREIRVAPNTMRFSMGYWVYADKAVFLSSKGESLGFIIQSRELVDLLRAQFKILWQLSSPLKSNNIASSRFLDEMENEEK